MNSTSEYFKIYVMSVTEKEERKKGEDKNEEIIMGPNYFSQLIKTSNLHTYTLTHGNQTAEIKKQ